MGSSTYYGERHLNFVKLPLKKGLKMRNYVVINTKFDEEIGTIHWRGGWRQYVFQSKTYDEEDIEKINGSKYVSFDKIIKIDMSRSCMKELNNFIDNLIIFLIVIESEYKI